MFIPDDVTTGGYCKIHVYVIRVGIAQPSLSPCSLSQSVRTTTKPQLLMFINYILLFSSLFRHRNVFSAGYPSRLAEIREQRHAHNGHTLMVDWWPAYDPCNLTKVFHCYLNRPLSVSVSTGNALFSFCRLFAHGLKIGRSWQIKG